HGDEERQLAAVGRAGGPVRDAPPGRRPRRGRPDPAGDPALPRGHRHHLAGRPELPAARRGRLSGEWGISPTEMAWLVNAGAVELVSDTVAAGASPADARKWWPGGQAPRADAPRVG